MMGFDNDALRPLYPRLVRQVRLGLRLSTCPQGSRVAHLLLIRYSEASTGLGSGARGDES